MLCIVYLWPSLARAQSLKKYGVDLVELAEKGKLDPVIGRDDCIARVVRVLSRRTKNNPILIGEPGGTDHTVAAGTAPPTNPPLSRPYAA